MSIAFVLALAAIASACGPGRGAQSITSGAADPLAVDAKTLARYEPRLAAKIARRPLAYFRYTNRSFVDIVCARYATSIPTMPMVHAHGDAHLEQYAVAAEGRGLADFDASAAGPPVVDLVRFATSLVLALPKDEAGARTAIAALLRGYDRALVDPRATVPEPALVARIRSQFAPTTLEWLDRVQTLIVPTPPEKMAGYAASWKEFVGLMRKRDPAIDPAFFKIKVGGRLDMGIGSAYVDKFLVRIEGPTGAADDDLIMEAKGLMPGALGNCMHGVDLDATRVIVGQAQISRAPQRFLAAMKIDGKQFYSHTWLVHYTELHEVDIKSAEELAEISEDVGLQLGRGHAKLEDESRVPQHRLALRKTLAAIGPELPDVAVDLARQVNGAWQKYRSQLRP